MSPFLINYPEGVCGKGYNIFNCKDKKIAVINAIGRAEINVQTENPFLQVRKIVDEIKEKVDMIFLDFHAEATAEKQAMGYYLDGDITAMFGTHTHVVTADEEILEKGTAYITDIGMTDFTRMPTGPLFDCFKNGSMGFPYIMGDMTKDQIKTFAQRYSPYICDT